MVSPTNPSPTPPQAAASSKPATTARQHPLEHHPHFEHDPKLPQHVTDRLRHVARMLGTAPSTVLDREEFREFPLIGKLKLSSNTSRYRFGLNDNDSLGLGVCQHVSLAAIINGKRVMRTYTPISLNHERGYFDLVVKKYPDGVLTSHLDSLAIGDTMLARGPRGEFVYRRGLTPYLVMIAGGSGITPMYQAIKSSLLDAADTTTLRLIYANEEEDDILLRNELDFLATMSNGRFEVIYVLHKPNKYWRGAVGFVQPELIAKVLDPERKCRILLCGPPPMVIAVGKQVQTLGFPKPGRKVDDQVVLF